MDAEQAAAGTGGGPGGGRGDPRLGPAVLRTAGSTGARIRPGRYRPPGGLGPYARAPVLMRPLIAPGATVGSSSARAPAQRPRGLLMRHRGANVGSVRGHRHEAERPTVEQTSFERTQHEPDRKSDHAESSCRNGRSEHVPDAGHCAHDAQPRTDGFDTRDGAPHLPRAPQRRSTAPRGAPASAQPARTDGIPRVTEQPTLPRRPAAPRQPGRSEHSRPRPRGRTGGPRRAVPAARRCRTGPAGRAAGAAQRAGSRRRPPAAGRRPAAVRRRRHPADRPRASTSTRS